MLRVTLRTIIYLGFIMLSVAMLSLAMLTVIILSVIMQTRKAEFYCAEYRKLSVF
jgi:hypothetical protein